MEDIYKLGFKGQVIIKHYESCKLEAYQDSKGIWTIGTGNTYYEDGTKVKEGDTISQKRADELFKNIANGVVDNVNYLLRGTVLKQEQFDALVSFVWNVGDNNFKKSTLLKKVYTNPNDKTIPNEFMEWVNSGGRKLKGLVFRRKSEAVLYTTGEIKFFN